MTKAGLSNARIIDAKIIFISLPDASVDCIISNCVINLVPAVDKPRCVQGDRSTPEARGQSGNMALYVGCVAGTSLVEKYEEYLGQAGFEGVLIVDTKSDLNVYQESSNLPQGSCCAGGCGTETASAITDLNFNEWVGSFQIYAIKAKGCSAGSYSFSGEVTAEKMLNRTVPRRV
ncbi:hypothetical protein BO82DRAFT_394214 [Aspergillus uvarum CBS 121591]|uniref:Uncharacterized protein n=1 Tax=Aspergillus uvarum CBS 121591 TaxID=1448315 RepID=A0A319CTY3_9EURO|nr:hypothetical protein BO82DRAFT_394214 [Aspergillus uvarum CBS 121591]PYH79058.1 hypothetical protein BO82DRAFT_394214 [Aspergillus uvarum CBS 121591]